MIAPRESWSESASFACLCGGGDCSGSEFWLCVRRLALPQGFVVQEVIFGESRERTISFFSARVVLFGHGCLFLR